MILIYGKDQYYNIPVLGAGKGKSPNKSISGNPTSRGGGASCCPVILACFTFVIIFNLKKKFFFVYF